MPRHGAIILRDIERALPLLRIECERCGRKGRYRVAGLIERYGRDAPLFRLQEDVTRDCPQRRAFEERERCAALFPDLPKVL